MKDTDAARSRRALELFAQAIDLGIEDRQRFLDELRHQEADLAERVAALLAADERAEDHSESGFLDQPAVVRVSDVFSQSSASLVGPWRLGEALGRGGMGMVYLADRADGQYEQTVALKIISRALDEPEMRRRFEAERQILARLEHPRIARLIDGGVSEDGYPYFAMEKVTGQPITHFADRQGLGTEQRLKLFLQVCDAVQYLHRNLVVHRDLKPSNVFASSDGVKLLDFGIAKSLDEQDNSLTRTGHNLLTPEYASPEQVRGEAVNTQSDVYSLGLLFYELLCGHRAHEFAHQSAASIEHVVCTVDPPPPSGRLADDDLAICAHRGTSLERLRREIQGDLNAIVMAALRKEPHHRTASVEAMADDVRRHLEGLPVRARPPSARYRAGKFLRRHALPVAATTAVAVSLVLAVIVAVASAVRVNRALEQSLIEESKARETSDFLLRLFEVADPWAAGGEDITARELLDRGAERITVELASQPKVQGALLGEIGRIFTQLGMLERADQTLRQAIKLQRSASADADADLARNLHHHSLAKDHLGETDTSIELARQALALRRKLHGEEHPDVAESEDRLASVLAFVGRVEEAEALARGAVAKLQHSVGPRDERTGTAMHNLAWILKLNGDLEGAADLYRQVLEIDTARLGSNHQGVIATMSNLAISLRLIGELDEAEQLQRRVLEVRRRTLGDDHYQVGETLSNLAKVLQSRGEVDQAATLFNEALEIAEGRSQEDYRYVATVTSNLAQLEAQRGNLERASELFEGALEEASRHSPGDQRLIEMLLFAGRVEMDRERYDRAETLLEQAVALAAGTDRELALAEAQLCLGVSRARAQRPPSEVKALLAEALPLAAQGRVAGTLALEASQWLAEH